MGIIWLETSNRNSPSSKDGTLLKHPGLKYNAAPESSFGADFLVPVNALALDSAVPTLCSLFG